MPIQGFGAGSNTEQSAIIIGRVDKKENSERWISERVSDFGIGAFTKAFVKSATKSRKRFTK